MTRTRRSAGLVLALGMLAWPPMDAGAHSYTLGDITVGHVWAPPPEQGADAVPVYGPIVNRGDAPARLVGASSPDAAEVRFRIAADGETRWPETLELPPGRPLALAAWRAHIWVSGLRRPLAPGDSFPLTLDFGAAGSLTVEVVVEDAGGH